MFDEVIVSNLIVVDMQGKVVEGDVLVNLVGFIIYSVVYMVWEDVYCVIYIYMLLGMVVVVCEDGLLQFNQISIEFYQCVGYYFYEGVVFDFDEWVCIQCLLGNNIVMILQSYGLLLVGCIVVDVFYIMYYLNCVCEIQMVVVQLVVFSLIYIIVLYFSQYVCEQLMGVEYEC